MTVCVYGLWAAPGMFEFGGVVLDWAEGLMPAAVASTAALTGLAMTNPTCI